MDQVEIYRQAIFRQVLELSVAARTPTLLAHFHPNLETLYEFCTHSDQVDQIALRYQELKRLDRVTVITLEELQQAPVPAEEQQRKIEQLMEAQRALLEELERVKGSNALGLGPYGQGDLLSSLVDPRDIRLPGWGGSIACLMVYKHILLTGMWRGQPVRIVETMHLDLDLRDGEVYLCSQPWLFHSANGKGSQKPRHEHHTFKFQRQLPPSKSAVAEGITHRKARCARKKCNCDEHQAFELVGARLTYSTRELTLYHFRKTPIQLGNIHPRHYAARDDAMEAMDQDDGEMHAHGDDSAAMQMHGSVQMMQHAMQMSAPGMVPMNAGGVELAGHLDAGGVAGGRTAGGGDGAGEMDPEALAAHAAAAAAAAQVGVQYAS